MLVVGCCLIPLFPLKVLMKDITTPVPPNEVRAVIKKSLENAALVNYERLSEEARVEGKKSLSCLGPGPK